MSDRTLVGPAENLSLQDLCLTGPDLISHTLQTACQITIRGLKDKPFRCKVHYSNCAWQIHLTITVAVSDKCARGI